MSQSRGAWVRRYLWTVPTATTLVVATYHSSRRQLWRDELATWTASSRSLGELAHLLRHTDAVLGPYYLLMHGWVRVFGDSVAALRAPAVLCMAGAAGLTTRLGQRLSGTATGTGIATGTATGTGIGIGIGIVAGELFALLPATSRYAQEARPYALATLFAVLATLLLVRAIEVPTRWRWTWYAVAVAAVGLAQLTALLLLAGHAVAVWRGRRGTNPDVVRRWLLSVAAVLGVLAPLAWLGHRQQSRQLGWVHPPTWAALRDLPAHLVLSAAVAGLLLGLALLALGRRQPWSAAVAASAALPALLLFGAGLVMPVFVPRYLTFTLPFACLLAAAGVTWSLPHSARWAVPAAAVLLVGLLGLADQAAVRSPHAPGSIDYAGAAAIIAARQAPGDGIVFVPRQHTTMLDLGIGYHLRTAMPTDVLQAQAPAAIGSFWAAECAKPELCLAHVPRLWLVGYGRPADLMRQMLPATAAVFRSEFRIAEVRTVSRLTVALAIRR